MITASDKQPFLNIHDVDLYLEAANIKLLKEVIF